MTATEVEKPVAELIRVPLMSGHCSTHKGKADLSVQESISHQRCIDNGSGNRANPWHEYQPCPCPHHYLTDEGEKPERYECSECGLDIIEVPNWPKDEDGDSRYSHVDGEGRALGEECHAVRAQKEQVVLAGTGVSGNADPEPEPHIEVVEDGDMRVTITYEAAVPEYEDDLSDLDDEDDFSDLDDL